MGSNTKDAQKRNAKLMLLILKKNGYDQGKSVKEYAETRNCTVQNAYHLLHRITKYVQTMADAPMLINDLLHTNNKAIKRALQRAIDEGDFMEYERVVKLQIEALGLGTKHTNVNVNNPQFQQQNNLFSASTEELLSLVREGNQRFGKLLNGPGSSSGEGETRAIEVLSPESRGTNRNPFLKEQGNMGNGGKP